MSVTQPSDAEARRAIRDDLSETLVVEAAAGTGKTTELINRVLRLLESPPPIGAAMKEIVAVTFTEKAAGELKLRLRERLEEERARVPSLDVQARLERALETLEEAHVNTIHGFCADLLRERPVEAGVDPMFTVLSEPQADRLYQRAFGDWLQSALQRPPEGLRRALRRTSAAAFSTADGDGPVDRVRRAGRELSQWRGFDTPWQRPAFDRDREVLQLVDALHAFADLTDHPTSSRDPLFTGTDAVRRLSQQIKLEASLGTHDLDGWESRLVDLSRERGLTYGRKGSGRQYSTLATRVDVLAARDAFLLALQGFRRDADADLAACLQTELADATAEYQELKRAAGVLDYVDLLACARDLIRNDGNVRRHLQRQFSRVFVDEFQDTDPLQAEIMLLLAADDPDEDEWTRVTPMPGKLFIVGDPKQAIYRFRGTDVGTYWQVSRQIEARGGKVVQLTRSYRSVPEIQRLVNAAFGAAMTADEGTLQAAYVPLAEHRPGAPDQPAIVALPVPRPYSTSTFRADLKATAKAVEASLPDVVGAFIAWLVDEANGWTVVERTVDGADVRVPIRPRHIAVLFRRFVRFDEDVTRAYTDAIEARGIPHLLVGGKAFHGREEVETLRAALAAIEWPDDELSVFATLKGSLFAIEDSHLLEFRHRFGALHPFRIPKALGGNRGQDLALTAEPTAHLMPIADALRLLQEMHRARNYRPVADTVGRLLVETRAHVGFVLRPAGEQALANVLHVAELARQYEAGGGISFRGFIEDLRAAAESEGSEAPILEEGSDGVRLMTVHKAKGLEFPVVILADTTCKMNRGDASRYLDPSRRLCALKIAGWTPFDVLAHEHEEVARDEAEGVRLAYVAATRARDLLVIPAVGDEPWAGGWYSPLNRAIYPPIGARRAADRGPGCPVFASKDTVLERPNDEPASTATVCPGRHAFPEGYSVVWWDPTPAGGLTLGLKATFGVRRDDLIVKDVPKHVVADGRTQYDRWRLARMDAVARGSSPTVQFDTVRRWSESPAPLPDGIDGADVAVVSVGRADESRPSGPAFGALVHAVLAAAAFDAQRAALEQIGAAEARALGLPAETVDAAVRTAERVLAHDLLVRAGAAERRGACRRETPVTLALPDGTLLEGIVDLAFEDGGQWTVVDYKTDRELESGEASYRRQVAVYAAAVSAATSRPAKGAIVRV